MKGASIQNPEVQKKHRRRRLQRTTIQQKLIKEKVKQLFINQFSQLREIKNEQPVKKIQKSQKQPSHWHDSSEIQQQVFRVTARTFRKNNYNDDIIERYEKYCSKKGLEYLIKQLIQLSNLDKKRKKTTVNQIIKLISFWQKDKYINQMFDQLTHWVVGRYNEQQLEQSSIITKTIHAISNLLLQLRTLKNFIESNSQLQSEQFKARKITIGNSLIIEQFSESPIIDPNYGVIQKHDDHHSQISLKTPPHKKSDIFSSIFEGYSQTKNSQFLPYLDQDSPRQLRSFDNFRKLQQVPMEQEFDVPQDRNDNCHCQDSEYFQ